MDRGIKPGFCALIIVLLFSAPGALMAQDYNQTPKFLKANSKWAIGLRAGIDFNSSPLTTFVSGYNHNIPPGYYNPFFPFYNRVVEGGTAVADPVTGNLLFYTGGPFCWNANGGIMPNGDDLLGNWCSTTQGVCAVPMIDSPGKYFLFNLHGFTDHQIATSNTAGTASSKQRDTMGDFFYSVVDMSLDGGLGDIEPTRKDILLYKRAASENMGEGLIAIPGNNCDIWVVIYVRGSSSSSFLSYHITQAGLDPVPVVSPTSNISGIGRLVYGMAVSPDRSMVAASDEKLQLLRFDPNTGILSDRVLIANPIPSYPPFIPNGAGYVPAFSPDNTKIYFNDLQNVFGATLNQMLQCEIGNFVSGGTVGAAMVIGDSWVPQPKISYLRLFRDTIYFTRSSIENPGNPLGIIANSNNAGTACNYIPNGVTPAPGSYFVYTLPNEVVYPIEYTDSRVWDTSICFTGLAPVLTLNAQSGVFTYTWDNGDTTASRQVNASGTYWVSYKGSCSSGADTFKVTFTAMDTTTQTVETYACDGDSARLQAPPGATAYLWNDGATGSERFVKTPGIYIVSSFYQEECRVQTDSFRVDIIRLDVDLGPDTAFCGPRLILDAITPGATHFLWQDQSNEPTFTVKEAGVYTVTVSREDCSDSDSILVTSDCSCVPFIPNAFTPNKDHENDVFAIKFINCPVANFNLSIYNRYGQRVFETDNPEAGWDGTFKGKLCDMDVYFYYLRYETADDQTTKRKGGDLTLVR